MKTMISFHSGIGRFFRVATLTLALGVAFGSPVEAKPITETSSPSALAACAADGLRAKAKLLDCQSSCEARAERKNPVDRGTCIASCERRFESQRQDAACRVESVELSGIAGTGPSPGTDDSSILPQDSAAGLESAQGGGCVGWRYAFYWGRRMMMICGADSCRCYRW